jgi:hypothetical protein
VLEELGVHEGDQAQNHRHCESPEIKSGGASGIPVAEDRVCGQHLVDDSASPYEFGVLVVFHL